jgi:hypothetical protein
VSPTEFELRAALRRGEGDGPDADAIIRHAGQLQRQRRQRLGGGLAAAAVVAGVAVGGGYLVGSTGGDDRNSAGSSSGVADGYQTKQSTRGAAGGSTDLPQAASDPAATADCPAAVPRLMLPGGGGTGQFGSSDTLLPQDASSVLICAYGPTETPQAPTGRRLTGADARALAASLDAAATVHQGTCPQFRTLDTEQYVLIGRSASGGEADPVVLTLAGNQCRTQATNGTAVRYGWVPPASLAAAFPAGTSNGTPSPQHS